MVPRRGHRPPECRVACGPTLSAILAAAGLTGEDALLFADLSLGAWRPHQVATELALQLGLANHLAPPPLLQGDSTADLIGALIDRETAGYRPVQQAFAQARTIAPALLQPGQTGAIVILAPLDGTGIGEDNASFLHFLWAAAGHRWQIVFAGRHRPNVAEGWVAAAEAEAHEPSAAPPASPLPPWPGLVTQAAARSFAPAQLEMMKALRGGARLIPVELRQGGASNLLSGAERQVLATWHEPADVWTAAFAAMHGGAATAPVIPLAWRALAAGSHELAARIAEGARKMQQGQEGRARVTSVLQGMRIGMQSFAAVAEEPDPDEAISPQLRARLFQHKGWGLAMTGRAEEALPYLARAKALLATAPATREFLYLLNIEALVHFRRGDLERALELERQMEAELSRLEPPDWHLLYINALNTARLLLRRGDLDDAAMLFGRAFDTARGVWTAADLIARSVYAARIAEARGDAAAAADALLKAALTWAAMPVPEAVPIRLARLILGTGSVRRADLAEAISAAFCSKLLDLTGRPAPGRAPPVLVESREAPPGVLADSGTEVIGSPGWAVIVSPSVCAAGFDGEAHRTLRALVAEMLSDAQPAAGWEDARTIVVDEQWGRGLPATYAEAIDLSLRTGVHRGSFGGEPLFARASPAEWLEVTAIGLGPAVAGVEVSDESPTVSYRRYRPPRPLSAQEADALRSIETLRTVRDIRAAGDPESTIACLRALERDQVVCFSVAQAEPAMSRRSAFDETGFAVLNGFASEAEVLHLTGLVDAAIEADAAADPAVSGRRGNPGVGELIWLRRPELYEPRLSNCFATARARTLAAALLDRPESHIRVSTRIFAKPAATGSIVPWHQDAAYTPDDPGRLSVNVWIPLDEATPDSGCLHFVPGSHHMPGRPHRPYAADPSGMTLEADLPEGAAIVACPVSVGSASVHHNRTLHHSPPNRSGSPRRVLVVVCEVASA